YLVNFIALPTGTYLAGTYSLVVQAAPAAATATLQASATSVSSGGTVTLEWSSANTTSCTASSTPGGVWSGNLATSGTAPSGAITASTVFTVTCAGSDGTTPTQSVTVGVSSGSSGSSTGHGGGGSIQLDVLLMLGALIALRLLSSQFVLSKRPLSVL